MSGEEILAAVAALARDKLGYEGELSGAMRLVEDLELDSIRLMTLAMEVEDRFRICLDEDDEAAIVTVADLIAAVGRKLESKDAP
jgi:acyl carrier protein